MNINGKVFERFEVIPRLHAGRLLPMIQSLMSEHSLKYTDLDAIAFGRGPGSFTGLRIATGVAQGIAFGAGLHIIPVSTLAALAMQVKEAGVKHVFSCLDARINEVYWGLFEFSNETPELLGKENLCAPKLINNSFLDAAAQWVGAGNGFLFLDEMAIEKAKLSSFSTEILPHAADVAKLASIYYKQGIRQKPSEVAPIYLRDKVTNN